MMMVRANKRIMKDIRRYCAKEDVTQRAFWEEAAARLLFQEELRKRRGNTNGV